MATGPKLELFTYWRSSCSYRVRIALGVKGLAYEPHFVNLLKGEQRDPSYVQKNPMGYVPALVVDGRTFTESVAIIELLEDLFPAPALFPKDPFARARVRALIETVNAGTQPMQNLNVLEKVSSEHDARNEWGRHFVARGLKGLEGLMEQNERDGIRGKFAYGDTPTAADCFLVPQIYNARRFKVDLAPMPRVLAASEAAFALDAVQAASPERQPDAKP